MSTLVIDITARKTNMLQALGILTPAPVLPAVLAMHALDKKMNNRLGVRGVGLIHRHATPWMEYLDQKTKNGDVYLQPRLVQRRGAYLFDNEKNVQGIPMQPMALADIELTLLLDCEHDVSEGVLGEVKNTLYAMRLAGGPIQKAAVRAFSDWDKAVSILRGGRWIDDVTVMIAFRDEPNPVRALLSATRSRKGEWVVPANLGYALLEDPGERTGARDGYPHAFVENMIGLVRYTPLSFLREELRPSRLWRYGWDGDQFLVTNRSDTSLAAARAA